MTPSAIDQIADFGQRIERFVVAIRLPGSPLRLILPGFRRGVRVEPAVTDRPPHEFGRYVEINRKQNGLGKPEIFTFLGFTFTGGVTR
jgi:hypothetical protein